ncbi:MAG TPA: hypothetical protein VGO49_22660 [Bradyrhizobium sp.]|jgi:hypothetical protein|nr:hypothetical protein [Bradyrhizobium sp.]
MTPRERKDIRWIITGFVVMLVVACVGIFAGMRPASEHAGTVDAGPDKQQMVMSTEKPPRDRHLSVGKE